MRSPVIKKNWSNLTPRYSLSKSNGSKSNEDPNRIRETEKNVFSSRHEHGKKKKFWVPMRNLRPSDSEHRSAESEGLKFHSSWGLRIFSLSHARERTKKHLSQRQQCLKNVSKTQNLNMKYAQNKNTKKSRCDENFYCDYRIKNIQARYTNSLGFTNVARKGFFAHWKY